MTKEKREYFRVYMLRRYHDRRKKAIDFLGGKCAKCGCFEKLEIDHKDKDKKSFDVSKLWSINIKRFWEEIKKCQILCQKHHIEKTVISDFGRKMAKGNHGTLSCYRYCKCVLCKKVKSEWQGKYRLTHKRKDS